MPGRRPAARRRSSSLRAPRIPDGACVRAGRVSRHSRSRARAAPRGRRADERDADAGVRRRKSVDARDPRPRGAGARPTDAEWGVTVAWVVGYQAKGFIHRENTAHGDPCDSPETLPLAHAHW